MLQKILSPNSLLMSAHIYMMGRCLGLTGQPCNVVLLMAGADKTRSFIQKLGRYPDFT
jgi:hypothetical protein